MLNIIRKHNSSFLPTKGAFNRKTNDLMNTNHVVTGSSGTERRKQKRMRITSNKEKYLNRNGNKNLQYNITPVRVRNDKNMLPCYMNKKIFVWFLWK